MRHGLQPNAVWYVCVGAVVGSCLGLAAQIHSSTSIQADISAFFAGSMDRSAMDNPSELASPVLEDWPLEPIDVATDRRAALQRSSVTVRSGDTLLGLLRNHGISSAEAHTISQAMKDVFDPRDIRVGQQLNITVNSEPEASASALDALSIKVGPGYDVVVVRESQNVFTAQSVVAKTKFEQQAFRGTITSSLYEAAVDQGVPPQTLVKMIRLFSYDVDFQRDIRVNDAFELMFNRKVTEDGLVVANGDIEYASMTLRGKQQKIYAYEHEDGLVDHYNELGKGIRKALMRTPINGARLSSSFGRRKHPILGYTKMHRGVDFAAPHGTPIYAAGDGVIDKRHRWGSFGNYIKIRHGDGFSTAYAHMRSFAKGQSVGSRVKQGDVIGYVGTTGRSTGPHLHYEVHRNGGQVNPMKVRFPASKTLDGQELAEFQAHRDEVDKKWTRVINTRDLAFLNDE